jgi:hypothetical protein
MATLDYALFDTITLHETLTTNIKSAFLVDTLILNENYQGASDTARLSDILILNDSFFVSWDNAWFDHLTLTEEWLGGPGVGLIEDVLTLSDQYVYTIGPAITEIVFLEDEYTYNIDRTLIMSDSIVLTDAFVAEGVFATVIPNLHPGIVTISLDGLVLPAPAFGDEEQDDIQRIARSPRKDGSLVLGKQSYWPTTRTFKITLDSLNRNQAVLLRAKLNAIVAKFVVYIDHLGRSQTVVVTNPDVEIVETSPNTFSVDLELQVV